MVDADSMNITIKKNQINRTNVLGLLPCEPHNSLLSSEETRIPLHYCSL